MQKALKITSIVFGVLLVISAVTCLIMGIVFAAGADSLASVAAQGDNEAYIALASLYVGSGVSLIFTGIWAIVGSVISFVLSKKANDSFPKKGTLIGLGVAGIIFGAEVPGVIAIIYGAKNGN